METIFKIGDRVFDIKHGWGTVALRLNESEDPHYRLRVDFVYHRESYTDEGKSNISDAYRSLSFTEYDLINGGFSQERPPINYNDYIGEWGVFWDRRCNGYYISKLKGLDVNNRFTEFIDSDSGKWDKFKPLTEEELKIIKSRS